MEKQHIIIIGGGIGGLMTAIALNKKGIPSSIYEKVNAFDANGAGLGLWANATRILDEFGLLDKLLPFCNRLDEMRTSTSNGRPLNVVRLKKLEDTFHFPSVVLLRSDLQRVLLEAVPAAQIHFNKVFVKIENHAGLTRVHFADGTSELADAVVFADGIHSLARKDVFNLPPLRYAGRTSWRGVAQFDKPFFTDPINYEIFGSGRRIGVFPLPGNLAYWYAAVNMPETEAYQQKRTIEGVLSHFSGWSEPVETLIKSTPEHRLVLTNLQYSDSITQLVHGNLALLGDAAHPMTPDLGQGACQAIEDAYFLSDCLSQSASFVEGFKCYENKRLNRVKSIAKNSFRMGNLRQWENPIGLAFRNTLFRIMPEFMALKMLERNIQIKKQG